MILNIISRTWTFRHRNEITSVQAHSIGFSDLTSKFTNHQFEKVWEDRKPSFIWSHDRGIHHMSQTQPTLNNTYRGMKCWAQWSQGFIIWAKLNHSWTTSIGGWSAELNFPRDSIIWVQLTQSWTTPIRKWIAEVPSFQWTRHVWANPHLPRTTYIGGWRFTVLKVQRFRLARRNSNLFVYRTSADASKIHQEDCFRSRFPCLVWKVNLRPRPSCPVTITLHTRLLLSILLNLIHTMIEIIGRVSYDTGGCVK